MAEQDEFVAEMKQKARELERLLDDFGDRLRRMRQRNRQVEEEISSFESDLDQLRAWIDDHA
jgi:septal ring factor EnvC (AmiA/AmiB activator)